MTRVNSVPCAMLTTRSPWPITITWAIAAKPCIISTRQPISSVAISAATGKAAEAIVKEKGLIQVSDTGLIEKAVEKAIAANPVAVAEFKGGKQAHT